MTELDLNPQRDKRESLGSYDGWNVVGADSSTIGYVNQAYVTVLAPSNDGGPGEIRNLMTLDLTAKILTAFATLPLTPEQQRTVMDALSGYVSDQPPNALQNLINSAAKYVLALENRDSFLLEALKGLMQATANPKGQ